MSVTVKHPFVSTVPDSTDTSLVRPSNWNADHTITGLGTAAEKDVGVANGVASLDSTGKVPVSELPAAVIGALSYQGTWNASTNTPTLASGVGTKGYYYVVSVAGSTNLDGITDWLIGDWAVYNGTAWQKVDNTEAVVSVNGQTGVVVLTAGDISGAANAPTNTNITSMTGVTGGISSPDFIQFDTAYATTLTAGQLGWDGNNTLGIGMAGGNVIQHIGEDQFFYCKATSAITKGQVVMFTGAVGASGVPTGAPATGIVDGSYIMGVAAEAIATNGFGLVQSFGTLRNVNTSTYADGEILWYNPAVTGGLTATKPSAPNVKVQIAAVINGSSSGGGTILIRINPGSQLGGTDSNVQIGTPISGNTLIYDAVAGYWENANISAGTGVSVTNGAGTITVANTGVLSVSGTAPVVSSGGTTPAISMPAATSSVSGYLTSTDWTTFNNKGSGSVTSVAASVPAFLSVAGSPITSSGTLAITYSGTALPVANGGTGLTSTPANGALDIGNGSGFTRATLTAGSGVTITNASGAITIAASDSGATITDDTSTNATRYVNFTSATSGALSTINTSSTKLTYNPSTGAISTPTINTNNTFGFKNRFINGAMKIDQRNAGAAQTITAGAALAYTIDRWYAYCTGTNATGQRVAGSGNNQFNYRFTGAALNTAIGFGQRIESANCYDLAGQTCTLSVNLANSLLTTVTWTASYANTADSFGTLASPTVTSIATGTFTVSSTLTNYSVNIAIPSAATTGIQIVFSVGLQVSGTLTIGNAQLEVGATATSFDARPIGTELDLCQRYFEKSYDIETALGTSTTNSSIRFRAPSTSVEWPLNFSVKKRTAPTVTLYSTTGASGNIRDISAGADAAGGTTSIGQSWCFPFKSTAGTDGSQYGFHYTASAEL